MGQKTRFKVTSCILLFCLFALGSYSLAADEPAAVEPSKVEEGKVEEGKVEEGKVEEGIDISISNVDLPSKIYLNQRTAIQIEIANPSDVDLEDCTLSVEATDGSKTSQEFPFTKDTKHKVEVRWVPQKAGRIDLKIALKTAEGIKDSHPDNNQFSKTITVLTEQKETKGKR